ncbi:hypothetical protein TWF106_000513 [Orbilia oligospora]|uniref:Uncharacterized protein n=1 Tax=Orbilia oligospora TaxID=2813651 RepID=A0A7C8QCG5_ORBOL|nr:hypothetical protein TWF106_000513 [Orbilia oligospora]
METEKDYSLLRSLRYDYGIGISLLILRALLFGWDMDARMLLCSLISLIKSPKSKVEDTDTQDPWVVPDWYWAELSPFLDTYLTPKHLCSFLCAVIGMDRRRLLAFLLQYIQKYRTNTEKKDIECFIRDASTHHKITDSVWGFKICAARASIKMSKTFVEDSLTISRTVRSSEGAQIKNIKAFANLLSSRATCTRIYLQDGIPGLHQRSGGHRTGRCFPNKSLVGSDRSTFPRMFGRLIPSYKQFVLPVLILKYRGKILIPLSSPREEDSIFDSLFWLSPKPSYQDIDNTLSIFGFNDFLSFVVMAVGKIMFKVISREAHNIRGINGNITPLGSMWMVHQNGQISIPPQLHQEPTRNSGYSSRETAHESSDWKTAICNKYKEVSMILKGQNKCSDTLTGDSIGILPLKTEYESAGVLENDYNVRVSRRGLERAPRRMKDMKFAVSTNLRSNEDGVIHNIRQRRKLLRLAAIWYNDTEILECLIGKGVGANAPSVSDLGTALQICCRRPTAALPPGVKRIETVRILVEAGATINPRDPDDTRPQFTLLTVQSSLVTLQWPDTS